MSDISLAHLNRGADNAVLAAPARSIEPWGCLLDLSLQAHENIDHLVFRALSAHGRRVLVESGEQLLSGAEIAAQAASVAGALADHGIQAGDRVIISRRDPVETLLGYLAIWHLGASPLVLDFRSPVAEVNRIATLAGVRLAVLQRSRGNYAVPHCLWEDDWRTRPGPPAGIATGEAALNAPVHIGLTSGTTGQPSVILHQQKTYLRRLNIRAKSQAEGAGRLLVCTSLQFNPPLVAALINLILGDPVQFHPILFTPDTLIEAILASKARMVYLPPPIIRRLVHHVGERSTPLFPDLRILRSVGGPAFPEDKIAAYKRLSPGYTMAYSSHQSGIVAVLKGEDVLTRPETTGRILDGVQVQALDEEGNVLPLGIPGRLRFRSGNDRSEAGSASGDDDFGADWVMPGDIGFADAEGFLTILGRQDDVIVRGGVNVSIVQLEEQIMQCADVEDVAVLGIADDAMGEEIVAAVVGTAEIEQIKMHCVAHIPAEKRPRKIVKMDALPYSIAGKLLRRKIDPSLFRN